MADRARLTDFARRTFEETFAARNTPEDMQAYLDDAFNDARQAAELSDTGRVTLLAESGGVLVGYAQLRSGEPPSCVSLRDSVELVRLYVDRAFQGRGLAHRLMEAAETIAAVKARGIWLGVWEHNPRAIAFYNKRGFVAVGTHEFRLGSDLQTDHIMLKSLAK